MQLYDAIHRRRTIHDYLDRPLPEGAFERIIDAAHQAPNHKLTWPWRFSRIGRETREKTLLPLGIRLKAPTGRDPSPKLVAKITEKLMHPAELVVVSLVRCDDAFRAREDYAAAACAIQNLQLAATAEGAGAKWSSGGLTTHPETYAAVGIDPEVEEIIAFVWIGVPAKVPSIKRPPLEAVLRAVP